MARISARRRSRRWSRSYGPCTRRMNCPRAIRLSPANLARWKNRVSNESVCRDDIQIMAAGLRSAGRSAVDRRSLFARMAAVALSPAARVRRRAPRFVSVRDCGDLARHRFAARRLRKSAFDRAHGSAPDAVDGCAAVDPLRSALPADLARLAGARVEIRTGAVSRFSRIAAVWPPADPSAGLLARVYNHESDVAHAGVL